jgi:hypothetical protein
MMQRSVILAATAVSVTIPSNAEARTHHRIYGHFDGYGFVPGPYRYAAPYRYYNRLGSNLNPDRQMVGQGE